MIRVFISHSSKDKPFARELADFLDQDGEAKVWLDEREIGPGQDFVSKIEEGIAADVTLLVLSHNSADSHWVETEWKTALADNQPIATVWLEDCSIPRLLKSRDLFDLRQNRPEGMRRIKSWLAGRRKQPPTALNLPSRPPLFVGREAELEQLRELLKQPGSAAAIGGLAGLGKTVLALEFAHRFYRDFEGVYWVQCEGRNLAALAGDLDMQFGLALKGDLAQVTRELKLHCQRKRYLLVFDNVENEEPGELVPGGRSSVLVTSRLEYIAFLDETPRLKPELFTEDECFDVFRRVLGEAEVARSREAAKALFTRVGYLPIAVSVAAGLIKHDVRHTIESLAKKPLSWFKLGKRDVGGLLKAAITATGENERKLLAGMAVCAREGFRLRLAAEVAGLDEEASLEALQMLRARSLVDELDRGARRYRLHPLIREAAEPGDDLRLAHARAVDLQFKNWQTNWRECEEDLGDLKQAFEWALDPKANDDRWRLAGGLAHRGYLLTWRRGRLAEAFQLCEQNARVCEIRGDWEALQAWYRYQAGLLSNWGRLEEAMALHKKGEAVCEELGNRDGLQASYGYQALILRAWGRLNEAMALLKKQEAICNELGKRDGLQLSYGNQALILRDCGQLAEAMALYSKQEAICIELGDRESLQITYNNQAMILAAWGWLDVALDLLRRQEAICMDLGLRSDMAFCLWGMAGVARQRGNPEEALQLAYDALAIFTELGMPLARDGVQNWIEESRKGAGGA